MNKKLRTNEHLELNGLSSGTYASAGKRSNIFQWLDTAFDLINFNFLLSSLILTKDWLASNYISQISTGVYNLRRSCSNRNNRSFQAKMALATLNRVYKIRFVSTALPYQSSWVRVKKKTKNFVFIIWVWKMKIKR